MTDRSPPDGRIFISHSTADGSVAQTLCDHLERNGLKCWIAPRDIAAGQHYDEEIVRGLDKCDSLLMVLSKAAVASKHVEREVFLASERELRIVPIRIENVPLSESLQYQIGRAQWIDLKPDPTEADLDHVLGQISGDRIGPSPARHAIEPFPRKLLATIVLSVLALACVIAYTMLGNEYFGSSNALIFDESSAGTSTGENKVSNRDEMDGIAAAAVLDEVFGHSPPLGDVPANELALAMSVQVRRGEHGDVAPIADGGRLRSEVDQYSIHLRPQSPGHLYVFQVDSGGSVFWLFPKNSSEFSVGVNPVRAGERIRIPAEGQGELFLDSHRGVEQIYAVFSLVKWNRLEQQLSATRLIASRSADITIHEPFKDASTRGIGGQRPASNSSAPNAKLMTVFESDEAVLILRRWFYHE